MKTTRKHEITECSSRATRAVRDEPSAPVADQSAPKCSKVLPWRTGARHHAPNPYKANWILILLKGAKVFKGWKIMKM